MGCKIKRSVANKAGKIKLAFRLIFKDAAGQEIRAWEGTDLEDTAANRKLMEARATIINDEISRGVFNYLSWFPHGNKAGVFAAPVVTEQTTTIADAYEKWIATKKPPFVRKSRARDYRQHFNAYLLPEIGAQMIGSLDIEHLTTLRAKLIEDYGHSIKFAKEIIGSTLRAFYRDLPSVGLIVPNPFDQLPNNWWPKIVKPLPDPFDEGERDLIIGWLKERTIYWRFVYFQFHQGTRPSEAAALRLRHIDLRNSKMTIAGSRHLGVENAPKTAKSAATIDLFPNVAEVLAPVIPLRADPDDYLFRNTKGRPVDHEEIRRSYFNAALRALNIRQRDFYATRHTFISIALSRGIPSKWVAEHCRTSHTMIENSYGRWIKSAGIDPIAILGGKPAQVRRRKNG